MVCLHVHPQGHHRGVAQGTDVLTSVLRVIRQYHITLGTGTIIQIIRCQIMANRLLVMYRCTVCVRLAQKLILILCELVVIHPGRRSGSGGHPTHFGGAGDVASVTARQMIVTVGQRAEYSGSLLLGAAPGHGQEVQLVLGEGGVVLAPQVTVEVVALELHHFPANSTPKQKYVKGR